MTEIVIRGQEEIGSAARQFIDNIADRRLFAFYGEMGAGKTTFINALCAALGIDDEATGSPTFAIVNEYAIPKQVDGINKVYHFDFYRIDYPSEALDFGVEDYFDSGELCLMEWPEPIEPLLPDETVRVPLTVEPDGTIILRF
ncbi:MAG: tRNA (adenosine(37)-N6)-threonylcarbamoyltransferase complex ATPase subunit type 1 TsaE [Muribaculaceae bacterium]|nr:tRNA (adenosine(37)-N6)-threonylcarbamoyltransferase complex ATPase subunit type 1 TsaE [Muribaculaceae bacterium]